MILDEKSLSEAMSRKCGLCGAKAGEPCVNICQKPPQPLTDRKVHYYRIEPK